MKLTVIVVVPVDTPVTAMSTEFSPCVAVTFAVAGYTVAILVSPLVTVTVPATLEIVAVK